MIPHPQSVSRFSFNIAVSQRGEFKLFSTHNVKFIWDPCDEATKGGCEQICNKDGDNAVCACDSQHFLNVDGTSCDESRLLIILKFSSISIFN